MDPGTERACDCEQLCQFVATHQTYLNQALEAESYGGSGFNFDGCRAAMQYISELRREVFPYKISVYEGAPLPHQAAVAVYDMVGRMERCGTGRALHALVAGDLKDKDYKAVLPPGYHASAHALQADWEKETAALDGISVPDLGKKAVLCECALSCAESHTLADAKTFAGKRLECKNYVMTFVTAVNKVVSELGQAHLSPATNFLDKYQNVTQCLEQWTLKDIDWIYKKENEQEVQTDLITLRDGSVEADKFSESLQALVESHTSFKEAQAAFARGRECQRTLKDRYQSAKSLAAAIMFSTLVVDAGRSQSDVDKTEQMTMQSFGVDRQAVPQKIKDKLRSLPRKGGTEKEKSKGDDKEDKKKSKRARDDQSDDGKKKSKKDKKEKKGKK